MLAARMAEAIATSRFMPFLGDRIDFHARQGDARTSAMFLWRRRKKGRQMSVDACRRHDHCPFPGEDVGTSRFKGSYRKT
jgi:hypothetical protein